MTMGGNGPEVLVTLTTDYGKILQGLHGTKIKGGTHLATGIQVAGVMCFHPAAHSCGANGKQLALKHRQNKSQRQRIVVFVGSPIVEDEKALVKLAKKMKKNNVAVDFINFGETDSDNTAKLQAFIDAINSSDNSHLVTIPPGPHLLSDRLIATPIMGEGGASEGGVTEGGATAGEGSGGFEFGFDFDPNMDPELAMALRMSMEDEKARVARQEKEREEAEKAQSGEGSSNLEGIKEEDESTPLLTEEAKEEGKGKGPDKKDDDKMDTA